MVFVESSLGALGEQDHCREEKDAEQGRGYISSIRGLSLSFSMHCGQSLRVTNKLSVWFPKSCGQAGLSWVCLGLNVCRFKLHIELSPPAQQQQKAWPLKSKQVFRAQPHRGIRTFMNGLEQVNSVLSLASSVPSVM